MWCLRSSCFSSKPKTYRRCSVRPCMICGTDPFKSPITYFTISERVDSSSSCPSTAEIAPTRLPSDPDGGRLYAGPQGFGCQSPRAFGVREVPEAPPPPLQRQGPPRALLQEGARGHLLRGGQRLGLTVKGAAIHLPLRLRDGESPARVSATCFRVGRCRERTRAAGVRAAAQTPVEGLDSGRGGCRRTRRDDTGFCSCWLAPRRLGTVAATRPPRSLSAHSLADLPDFFRPL